MFDSSDFQRIKLNKYNYYIQEPDKNDSSIEDSELKFVFKLKLPGVEG